MISIFVWIIYVQFVVPLFVKPPKKQTPAESTLQPPDKVASEPSKVLTPTAEAVVKPVSPDTIGIDEADLKPDYTIGNKYFKAVFTNKGARLKSLTLLQYQSASRDGLMSLLNDYETGRYSLGLAESNLDFNNINWHVDEPVSDKSITFRCRTGAGLTLIKQFSAATDTYTINYRVSAENTDSTPITATIRFDGFAGISSEDAARIDIKTVRGYRESENKWVVKEEMDIAALVKRETEGNPYVLQRGDNAAQKENVAWTGMVNKYFTAVLIPANPFTEKMLVDYGFGVLNDNICVLEEIKRRKERGDVVDQKLEAELKTGMRNISFYAKSAEINLAPGAKADYDFIAYIGPKAESTLSPLAGKGLEKLISYGWFGFISVILLGILGLFYSLFGNYGWAIIALTILIKLLLFPMTRKGQVSMYKMQQLQPKIKALQEKYKGDKQKLGIEQMKLFKEHGVNPVGGCLPILFQLPVFIGLYQALYWAIELRHAPFMFWINDLSQPDKLCDLPFTILGATKLHLLPLLMTASWLVQSLTQPKSPDPQARQQQKIFTFMPLIFLFFFYNAPSGLTLYWFIQTLLSVAEQQYIKRHHLKI
ncbi:MAG: membrane protein insertase YidC [Planctomycetes bacterium]|nr:membrane protein insertase YidC [Planctomycetota bacterium]